MSIVFSSNRKDYEHINGWNFYPLIAQIIRKISPRSTRKESKGERVKRRVQRKGDAIVNLIAAEYSLTRSNNVV